MIDLWRLSGMNMSLHCGRPALGMYRRHVPGLGGSKYAILTQISL